MKSELSINPADKFLGDGEAVELPSQVFELLTCILLDEDHHENEQWMGKGLATMHGSYARQLWAVQDPKTGRVKGFVVDEQASRSDHGTRSKKALQRYCYFSSLEAAQRAYREKYDSVKAILKGDDVLGSTAKEPKPVDPETDLKADAASSG